MLKFEFTVDISASPERVFEFMTDRCHAPSWIAGLVASGAKSEPMKPGLRWVETTKQLGRTFDVSLECTHLDSPRRFGVRTLEPFRTGQVITLTAGAGGTRLHVAGGGDTTGFLSLAAPVAGRYFKRKFQGDYRRLKELVEAAAAVPAQTAVSR